MKKVLIVILGPTASGKTKLSIDLAKEFRGEIICADSRTVYRKLDIGTAKPTKKQQQQIPHHLIDIIEAGKTFTVAEFKKGADEKIEQIFSRGKIPFLTGGSGLYIDAVIYGLEIPGVAPNWKLRAKLEKLSLPDLFSQIAQKDPQFAKQVDKNNKRRLIRALEVMEKTGQKFSTLRRKNPPPYPILILGIDLPRKDLIKKIDSRIDERLKQGMIEEVKNLINDGVNPKWLDSLGLEYRYLSRYLMGKLSRQETIRQLKSASHQFARRQMTWFKRNKNIIWIKNKRQAEKQIKEFIQN